MKVQDLICPKCGRPKHPSSHMCESCITEDIIKSKAVMPLHASIGTRYKDRLKAAGIRADVASNFLANDKLKAAFDSLLGTVKMLEKQTEELYRIIEDLDDEIKELGKLVTG